MNTTPHININEVDIQWDVDKGTFTFFGIPSALFWINPSLMTMLKPLAEEVGHDLFRLQVAASASLGTEEDYHNMVTVLGSTFEEGFLKWGAAVSSAGWGRFELIDFSAERKRARVRIHNTWELIMQQDLDERWGCPFIQGKIIGIFTHALGVTCWADEVACHYDADNRYVEFDIYACTTTISEEIERTRARRLQEKERQLEDEIQRKTRELDEARLKAESGNYAKSKFLGSMSHELRTPLNAVIGFADILLRDKRQPLQDGQRHKVQHILDAGNNMLSLVNQVLRFSEVSITDKPVTLQAFPIGPVVDEVIELNQLAAERRSIQIENRFPGQQFPDIVGDAAYLKEILLIIVSNAVRYIEAAGHISIHGEIREGGLRLTVEDDGPGIDEAKVAWLFEAFERLDQHTGTVSGAGIGLPIASMLARVVGARIGYHRNQPQGAAFWVDLPLRPE